MNPTHDAIEVIISQVRKNLKEQDQIMPVFFIGSGDEVSVVGAQFSDEAQKDATSKFIHEKVIEWDADFVLFISEAWVLQVKGEGKDWRKERGAYHSLEDHPDAKEMVTFLLETKNRCWNANAEILSGREMAKIEWHEAPKSEGRFSNFFGNDKPTVQ